MPANGRELRARSTMGENLTPAANMCRFAAILALLPLVSAQSDSVPIPTCPAADKYLDISSLNCLQCPTGQTPSDDGLSCECTAGVLTYTPAVESTSTAAAWSCTACASAGLAPTRDGTQCLPCQGGASPPPPPPSAPPAADDDRRLSESAEDTLGLDDATGDCACADGKVLVERDALGALLPAKICLPCPAASSASASDPYTCTPCPADDMVATADGGCECAAGYVAKDHAGGLWGKEVSCMHAPSYAEVSRFASSSSYSVDFRDVVTENCLAFQYGPTSSQCSVCSAGDCTSEAVASATFDQLLLPAATECLRAVKYADGEPRDQPLNDGNEACQTLGNLCALAMYEADAAACQLFQQVALEQSSFVNQEDQWKMRMPWLYYSSGPLPYSIDNVDLRVALGIEGTYALTYWLASYSLNGTYLGLEKLGTQLQLCAGVASDPNAYLSFGTGLEAKCEVPLSRLLAVTEPTFYDLYLQVEGEKLYPVPTRVINLRVGGARVNDNVASSRAALENDQLVRRFFVVDGQSGRKAGESAPTVVRYLSAATLTVKTQKDLPNRIYAPVLELEYAEVRVATGADGAPAASSSFPLRSSFLAVYTMDLDRTNEALMVVEVMAVVVWVLGWFGKLVFSMRRNARQGVDAEFIVMAVAQVTGSAAATTTRSSSTTPSTSHLLHPPPSRSSAASSPTSSSSSSSASPAGSTSCTRGRTRSTC